MAKKSRAAFGISPLVPLCFSSKHCFLGLLYPLLAGFGLDLISGFHKHWGFALWLQFLLAHMFFLAHQKEFLSQG